MAFAFPANKKVECPFFMWGPRIWDGNTANHGDFIDLSQHINCFNRFLSPWSSCRSSTKEHGHIDTPEKASSTVYVRVRILYTQIYVYTLQGINISHLGKRKMIFKMPFLGDMLVSWRVHIYIYTHLLLLQ